MNTVATKRPRRLQGRVTSNKMQKTIVVRVDRLKKHPKYLKYLKTHQKFLVHDEKNEAGVGDVVTIREARPMSRRKRWMLESVITKGAISAETVEE
ncbi:MAG: 30S ribosomal protein S17 [Candidatus Sungbacteria bacterium RIFCSPHIGHO2_02_FULL_49_12]|uniref:Small ribosomal subunit protein uS17 n=1 Tax=Candidatus Sungbacteria bacterium RIFCSPHIGHO2_02_FULL_49_12 TaxID=1802271 RepID=A0A1G2KMR7_9BACT|nr:MAG: 30S ribosomal protein S17 [Candidatus Sungbacteria bacterium RIFCSPHIGHO2_02_FULL_49_12]